MRVAHRGVVEGGGRIAMGTGVDRRGRAVVSVAIAMLLLALYMIAVHDPMGVRVGNF